MGAGWPPVGRSQVEREKHLGSLIAGKKTKPANQEKGWRCQSPVAKWEKHSCHLNFLDGGSAYDSQSSIGLPTFESPIFFAIAISVPFIQFIESHAGFRRSGYNALDAILCVASPHAGISPSYPCVHIEFRCLLDSKPNRILQEIMCQIPLEGHRAPRSGQRPTKKETSNRWHLHLPVY